jgi:hypothetical protein
MEKRKASVETVDEGNTENEVLLLDNNVLKPNDDSRIFVDVSGAPIHNQRNEIIGGVLIFKDVSENKNWN